MTTLFLFATAALAAPPALGGIVIGARPPTSQPRCLLDPDDTCQFRSTLAGRPVVATVELCGGKVHKLMFQQSFATAEALDLTLAPDPKAAAAAAAQRFLDELRTAGWTLGAPSTSGATTIWSSGKGPLEAVVMTTEVKAMPPILPVDTWSATAMLDPNVGCPPAR